MPTGPPNPPEGDLHCGPAPLNPPRGTCVAAEKLCVLCQAAVAALCIFRTRKKLSDSVSLCSIKKLFVFKNKKTSVD